MWLADTDTSELTLLRLSCGTGKAVLLTEVIPSAGHSPVFH